MHKELQNFVSILKRANLKKSPDIRMSIDDANKLHAELTKVLLELNQRDKAERIIDGGTFK